MGDIPQAVIFPFSPVFSAYGSSVMDVVHLYEHSHRITFIEPGKQFRVDEHGLEILEEAE